MSTRPARSRVGELAGVSGLRVARAAAERMGEAGLVAAERRAGAGRRPWLPSKPCRPGSGPGHDRRRRRLQAWRGALLTAGTGSSRECERAPAGACSEDRLPTRPPHHRAHRRPRRVVCASRQRAESWSSCLRLGGGGGPGPVGTIGSGSNLLVADDGFRGLADQAGRRPRVDRARRRAASSAAAAPGCPRPRPRRRLGVLSGLEFGINIPGSVGGR